MDELGVIYATEIADLTVLEMLRQNYSVTFDRVRREKEGGGGLIGRKFDNSPVAFNFKTL